MYKIVRVHDATGERIGRKEGSGQYGEKTIIRRIPVSMVPVVDLMLEKWKVAASNIRLSDLELQIKGKDR